MDIWQTETISHFSLLCYTLEMSPTLCLLFQLSLQGHDLYYPKEWQTVYMVTVYALGPFVVVYGHKGIKGAAINHQCVFAVLIRRVLPYGVLWSFAWKDTKRWLHWWFILVTSSVSQLRSYQYQYIETLKYDSMQVTKEPHSLSKFKFTSIARYITSTITVITLLGARLLYKGVDTCPIKCK